MTTTPVLLVISTCARSYREYCLAQVAAHQPVLLIDPEAPTWQSRYVIDHEVADVHDVAAVSAAADALARRHTVAGVLTWDEFALGAAAHVAARLNLFGNSTATVAASRNKAASRAAFAARGVPSAASARVTTLHEAQRAAERIGYPVVLKPIAHAGSVGVIKAEHAHDLPNAYAHASRAAADDLPGGEGDGVLVEEYLDGPEISVECVTIRGVTTPVAVTRKQLGPEPYFEEVGHSVEAGDPLLGVAGPVAIAALNVLGVANGVSHVELRLTDMGPRIVEVNGRLGGDLIPHLVKEATGIDLPRAAADIALGLDPDLTPTRRKAAAISLIYAPATGRLARAQANDALTTAPWLERLVWEREVGDMVTAPPTDEIGTARLAHIVATDTTAERCLQHLADAEDHLDIAVDS